VDAPVVGPRYRAVSPPAASVVIGGPVLDLGADAVGYDAMECRRRVSLWTMTLVNTGRTPEIYALDQDVIWQSGSLPWKVDNVTSPQRPDPDVRTIAVSQGRFFDRAEREFFSSTHRD
jgi:hypothetical protein